MLIAKAMVDGVPTYGEVDNQTFCVLRGDPLERLEHSGRCIPVSELKLDAPVVPRRLFVMRKGFRPVGDSILGPGATPSLLPKIASAVSGQDGQIVMPSWASGPIWAEVELAVVIGQRIRRADRARAQDAIFGYTCFNDVTAFELGDDGCYFLAKSVDSFASLGPWIRRDITEDEIAAGLQLVARVDGVEIVRGTTGQFKFSPSEVVSWLSRYISLFPKDVISLGTPAPAEVRVGSDIELEIEGIGILRNHVIEERADG